MADAAGSRQERLRQWLKEREQEREQEREAARGRRGKRASQVDSRLQQRRAQLLAPTIRSLMEEKANDNGENRQKSEVARGTNHVAHEAVEGVEDEQSARRASEDEVDDKPWDSQQSVETDQRGVALPPMDVEEHGENGSPQGYAQDDQEESSEPEPTDEREDRDGAESTYSEEAGNIDEVCMDEQEEETMKFSNGDREQRIEDEESRASLEPVAEPTEESSDASNEPVREGMVGADRPKNEEPVERYVPKNVCLKGDTEQQSVARSHSWLYAWTIVVIGLGSSLIAFAFLPHASTWVKPLEKLLNEEMQKSVAFLREAALVNHTVNALKSLTLDNTPHLRVAATHCVNKLDDIVRTAASMSWQLLVEFQDCPYDFLKSVPAAGWRKVSQIVAFVFDYLSLWWLGVEVSVDPQLVAQRREKLLHPLKSEQHELTKKIRDLLDTQQEWAEKELSALKHRRAVYAKATEKVLNEARTVIFDSIHETREVARNQVLKYAQEMTHQLRTSIEQDLAEIDKLNELARTDQMIIEKVDSSLEDDQQVEDTASNSSLLTTEKVAHTTTVVIDEVSEVESEQVDGDDATKAEIVDIALEIGQTHQDDAAKAEITNIVHEHYKRVKVENLDNDVRKVSDEANEMTVEAETYVNGDERQSSRLDDSLQHGQGEMSSDNARITMSDQEGAHENDVYAPISELPQSTSSSRMKSLDYVQLACFSLGFLLLGALVFTRYKGLLRSQGFGRDRRRKSRFYRTTPSPVDDDLVLVAEAAQSDGEPEPETVQRLGSDSEYDEDDYEENGTEEEGDE